VRREAAGARQDDLEGSHWISQGGREVVQGSNLANEAGPTTTPARQEGRRPVMAGREATGAQQGGSATDAQRGGTWAVLRALPLPFVVGEGRF
jgi:hypothetical protein